MMPIALPVPKSYVECPKKMNYLKNLKKNMKNLKTNYGGTPQFIL